MLFLKKSTLNTTPLFLAIAGLLLAFNFLPPAQSGDPGIQGDVFAGATITTTAQSAVVACGQGSGMVGRKTIVVENASTSTGAVTVTAELRTTAAAPNFTSGYLAVNGVATNTASSATTSTTAAGGRFCRVTAVGPAGGATITVTLRRE